MSVNSTSPVENASYKVASNGNATLSFTVASNQTITPDNCLIITAEAGAFATGKREVWGNPAFSEIQAVNDAAGNPTGTYKVFDAWSSQTVLSSGQCSITLISEKTLANPITNVTIGPVPVIKEQQQKKKQQKQHGVTTTNPITSVTPLSNAKYSIVSGNGALSFNVSSAQTITQDNCLIITAYVGAFQTGPNDVWGNSAFSDIQPVTDAAGNPTGIYKVYDKWSPSTNLDAGQCTIKLIPKSLKSLPITKIAIGPPPVNPTVIHPPVTVGIQILDPSYNWDMANKTGTFSFSVGSDVTISKSNPIVFALENKDNDFKGLSISNSNIGGVIEQAGSSNLFNIYPETATLQLTTGTTYKCDLTLSGDNTVYVSKITIKPSGTITQPSGNIHYSYSIPSGKSYGLLKLAVGADTTISKSNPINLTTLHGTINTSPKSIWGDLGILTSEQVENSNIYQLYPPTGTKDLDAGVLYNIDMASTLNLYISKVSIGTVTPVIPVVKPITHEVYTSSSVKLRVGYVQLSGEHSAKYIASEGIQSCNVIVFAFASNIIKDATPENSPYKFMEEIQYIMDNSSSDTKFFYSVGGETNDNTVINPTTIPKEIHPNVLSQIKYINSNVTGGLKITGVDLDLEGGSANPISSDSISTLTNLFQNDKFEVSWAPQLVSLGGAGSTIDAGDPKELGLASGGFNNQYGDVLTNDKATPDYIFVQCYNTSGFTVTGADGKKYSESDTGLFTVGVTALNNYFTNIVQKPNIKVAYGFPSNRGGGGYPSMATIFAPASGETWNLSTSYDQATPLNIIKNELSILNPSIPLPVNGIMTWSLNNDYYPKLYQDNFAVTGLFCETIFGAKKVKNQEALPYMTIIVDYPDVYKQGKNVIVSLIIDGQYYLFGGHKKDSTGKVELGATQPLKPWQTAAWSTLTGIVDLSKLPSDTIRKIVGESGSLDQIALAAQQDQGGIIPCKVLVSLYDSSSSYLNMPLKQSTTVDLNLSIGCDNYITVLIQDNGDDDFSYEPPTSYEGAIIFGNAEQGAKGRANTSSGGFYWDALEPISLPLLGFLVQEIVNYGFGLFTDQLPWVLQKVIDYYGWSPTVVDQPPIIGKDAGDAH